MLNRNSLWNISLHAAKSKFFCFVIICNPSQKRFQSLQAYIIMDMFIGNWALERYSFFLFQVSASPRNPWVQQLWLVSHLLDYFESYQSQQSKMIFFTILAYLGVSKVNADKQNLSQTDQANQRGLQEKSPQYCFTDTRNFASGEVPLATYNFFSCMATSPTHQPCACTLTRTVSIQANQVAEVYPGEYLSLSECNNNCGRGNQDMCWYCTRDHSRELVCRHVQDAGGFVAPTRLFGRNACVRRCTRVFEIPCEAFLE